MFSSNERLHAALAVAFLLSLCGVTNASSLDTQSRQSINQPKRVISLQPPPQELSVPNCGKVSLTGPVTIVISDAEPDAPTVDVIKDVVAAAGGQTILSKEPRASGVQIFVGANTTGLASEAAQAMTGKSTEGLAAEGYVLAVGDYKNLSSIVLNGVDIRGSFYAAQTLRQLAGHARKNNAVPHIAIRDWPLMKIRGSIEGFYGHPWSHQARLDQFVFYGRHKMNTYIYTPKDDKFLRAKWRDLYGNEELALLKELVKTAGDNQVDFTFALSPGNDICYSSNADFAATVAKFDQLRNLGVRSFYVALDDIPTSGFFCDADAKKWPVGSQKDLSWLADAQTFYLNRLQADYVVANNLKDLQTVNTLYSGSDPNPYKARFGSALNKDVFIQWTGEGVFSASISVESVSKADQSYATDKLYIWDNFPVNDGRMNRLFLNALAGRDSDLYKHIVGFTSNPMVQPYASMIALANYGDYCWNGPAYNETKSFDAILRELAGSDENIFKALTTFADINQNWPYLTPAMNAPLLSKDVASFFDGQAKNDSSLQAPLKARLKVLKDLPHILPSMAMKGFASDAKVWLEVAMQWATATEHYIAVMDALKRNDQATADAEIAKAREWVEKTKAKTLDIIVNPTGALDKIAPTTGDGVFDTFASGVESLYFSRK